MALHLTGTAAEPELLLLPWHMRLESWPEDVTVTVPRGISRNIVRFVRGSSAVLAIKEIPEGIASREYALLFELQRRAAPCVEPIAVVSGRVDEAGQSLPGALVTRHLTHSMPYRLVMARSSARQLWPSLIDALVLLIVRLHLLGFAWNDCSLSNALFRRDAGEFAAYLVDAETGQMQPKLSRGQRDYDLDTAALNVMGELMDLQAGGLVEEELDVTEVGDELKRRYEHLWMTLTEPVHLDGEDRTPIYTLVRTLNGLGFDVGELTADATEGGPASRVSVRAKVVDAGHHRRRMSRLTGLDMQENQARRLLNDLDSFRFVHGYGDNEKLAARAWAAHVYDDVLRRIPADLAWRMDDAELVHEVMEHRWYVSERAGRDVGLAAATDDYVATMLPQRLQPEELAVDVGLPDDDLLDQDLPHEEELD
jgi:hypothetical protein